MLAAWDPVTPQAPARDALQAGAAVLRGSGLVVFPTESFYGLGAHALDAHAVARVFRVKGRPEAKPLLILVDSVEMLRTVVTEVPAAARALIDRHWPGPLTLVLRAAASIPDAVTAGTGTVGVRMPGHAVALGLVEAAGRPLTAPSANPSGEPPPTTAGAVMRYFGEQVDLILDGGPTAGGAGSTIADCTGPAPRVLRQGPIAV